MMVDIGSVAYFVICAEVTIKLTEIIFIGNYGVIREPLLKLYVLYKFMRQYSKKEETLISKLHNKLTETKISSLFILA